MAGVAILAWQGRKAEKVRIAYTQEELRYLLEESRRKGRVGFVPTMGALHEGHLSLVRRSRQLDETVVVSIFVNPTQFDDPSDLERYPRTLEKDIVLLERERVDVLFVPSVEELYPEGFDDGDAYYRAGRLAEVLEGAWRPGHFAGVMQVVAKLLRAVQPNRLYLGQKDYQQYLVLKQLVERHFPEIEVVLCPTVREGDGLALSSRNVRLSPQQRRDSLVLYRSLLRIKAGCERGEPLPEALQSARALLEEAPSILQVDYLVVCDATNLSLIFDWEEAEHVIALGAVRMKGVRLIDNIFVKGALC